MPQHFDEQSSGAIFNAFAEDRDDASSIRHIAHVDDISTMLADLKSDAIPMLVCELHDAIQFGKLWNSITARHHGSVSLLRFA